MPDPRSERWAGLRRARSAFRRAAGIFQFSCRTAFLKAFGDSVRHVSPGFATNSAQLVPRERAREDYERARGRSMPYRCRRERCATTVLRSGTSTLSASACLISRSARSSWVKPRCSARADGALSATHLFHASAFARRCLPRAFPACFADSDFASLIPLRRPCLRPLRSPSSLPSARQ